MKRSRGQPISYKDYHDGDDEKEDDWMDARLKTVDLCKIIKADGLKNFVIFTGSGISTLSGIKTYRGNGGIWTTYRAKQKKAAAQRRRDAAAADEEDDSDEKSSSSEDESMDDVEDELPSSDDDDDDESDEDDEEETSKDEEEDEPAASAGYSWRRSGSNIMKHLWFPNVVHMFIAKLVEQGLVSCVITQNCDDLHRKSGVPADKLVELHGNSFLEECPKCNIQYHRDFIVAEPRLTKKKKISHQTARTCTKCGTALQDTIVNFSEEIPEARLERAYKAATQCDMVIVMGSSLLVEPANKIPLKAKRFVVINLQSTPLDDSAEVVIHSRAEMVVNAMAQKEQLDIAPIPSYVFTYPLVINFDPVQSSSTATGATTPSQEMWLDIRFGDHESAIEHYINRATVSVKSDQPTESIALARRNRYSGRVQVPLALLDQVLKTDEPATVKLQFYVHFNIKKPPHNHPDAASKQLDLCAFELGVELSRSPSTRARVRCSTGTRYIRGGQILIKDRRVVVDASFDTKHSIPSGPDSPAPVPAGRKKAKITDSASASSPDVGSPQPIPCFWTVSKHT